MRGLYLALHCHLRLTKGWHQFVCTDVMEGAEIPGGYRKTGSKSIPNALATLSHHSVSLSLAGGSEKD